MSLAAKIVLALALFASGLVAGVKFHAGLVAERDLQKSKELLANINRTIEKQQARDQKIANSQGKKDAEFSSINARLSAELDGLRNRPTKRADPEASKTDVGATGAGLAMPDADFLAGFAAQANRLRSRLAQCQRDLDAESL